MSSSINKDRVYFFDAMRSLLIIFIVTTHVLQFFNPEKSWIIYTQESLSISPILIDFFMLFTLQSFFIMSGYLAMMSINKTGINSFFDSRIKKIFIPIIITALTFNSLQTYLLISIEAKDFMLYPYIMEGEWISHLWFLINLSIFFLLTYISIKFFQPIVIFLYNLFNQALKEVHLYIILFLFSLIIVMLLALFSAITNYVSNPIVNIRSLFFYFPFFALGILLFINKKLFTQFINTPIFMTFISTIMFILLSHYIGEETSGVKKIAYYFFDVLSNFFAATLTFTLFHNFFNRKSKIFSFLSEASYSIYLFHHLLVVLGGIILIKLDIGGYFGCLFLLFFVISLSLLIHHYLISKINFLAFLYNGKKLKKNKYV